MAEKISFNKRVFAFILAVLFILAVPFPIYADDIQDEEIATYGVPILIEVRDNRGELTSSHTIHTNDELTIEEANSMVMHILTNDVDELNSNAITRMVTCCGSMNLRSSVVTTHTPGHQYLAPSTCRVQVTRIRSCASCNSIYDTAVLSSYTHTH